jgi:putative copper export protein
MAPVIVAALHPLAGAAWLGSMFYSLTVLQPRAKAFFATDAEFEELITAISAGARWKVLGAFTFVGLSGVALFALLWRADPEPAWLVVMGCKVALFLAALAVFGHVSWRLWPRRVMASPAEVPALQRRFTRVGFTMITLVGTSMVLGVLARACRGE